MSHYVVHNDARPWSWSCDPCGVEDRGYDNAEDAEQAAWEHTLEQEALFNPHFMARRDSEKGINEGFDPYADKDWLDAERRIEIRDARLVSTLALEYQLNAIHELLINKGDTS